MEGRKKKNQDGFNNNCTQEQIWDCVPVLARQDTLPLSLSSQKAFPFCFSVGKSQKGGFGGKDGELDRDMVGK